MSQDEFSSAAVIGTGMMGPGIGLILAMAGTRTMLVSRSKEGAEAGLHKAQTQLQTLISHGLANATEAKAGWELLQGTTEADATFNDVDLVIESGPENLTWKQDFFEHLEQVTKTNTVLASNTSGLSITAIAAKCQHPERVLTTHFWNPPHLVPLVEIVKGKETAEIVANRVKELLSACGKTPVVLQQDRPGQLGNRLQMALVREAAFIISEGIATAEDVDTVLKRGLGLRYPAYGLLEHQDNVGLDLSLSICDYVSRDLYAQPTAPDYLRQLVKEGKLGAKTGQGFLKWQQGEADLVKAQRDAFLLSFLQSQRKSN